MNTLDKQLNLQLIPVETTKRKDGNYCRYCGDSILLQHANIHLLGCRPDIHDTIQREYDRKEAHAVSLTH